LNVKQKEFDFLAGNLVVDFRIDNPKEGNPFGFRTIAGYFATPLSVEKTGHPQAA
jgi:hypothetical protein